MSFYHMRCRSGWCATLWGSFWVWSDLASSEHFKCHGFLEPLWFSWVTLRDIESSLAILCSPWDAVQWWMMGGGFWVWSHLASFRSERLKYGLQRLFISCLLQWLKVQVQEAIFEFFSPIFLLFSHMSGGILYIIMNLNSSRWWTINRMLIRFVFRS